MPERPTGTVSLLFTDIAGSTWLLHRLGDRYGEVLEEHRRLLRRAFDEHEGREVDTQGDAFFAVFPGARQAVAAAAAAQRALAAHPWPDGAHVQVRMGIHTGEPFASGDGYVGIDVHKGARIAAAGHGGQVLLSQTTRDLAIEQLPPGTALRDLGEHRLKDIQGGQRLYQLVVEGLTADFPPLRTVSNRPSNLPDLPRALVGRQRELAEISALVRDHERLVTLTGPGGTGKTRLAMHAASALLDDVRDGVCFVSLEPISDPALVAPTIAAATGVRDGGEPVEERLREELRDRELLLVLDNFEQVVSAAPVVAGLLAACPRVKVLATSREVLHLAAEREYRVRPLPEPDALRLFEQRAQLARPGFAVTPSNEAAVAEICRRLDGLPLAVELAAARVKLLTPEAMRARLERRLHVLVGGPRDRPSRQQTLRAAIDWSYELLAPEEQHLLARLAVFAGGCALESAEAVCDPDADLGIDVLDGATSLLDKSLVLIEESDDGLRVTMLQTIHEYAAERLQASGEREALAARHAEHYLALAEDAEPELWGADQQVWFRRLDVEQDNMRAALSWALGAGDAEFAMRLAGALGAYWEGRGQLAEAHRWLTAALAAGPASAGSRGRALMASSRLLLLVQEDAAQALPLLEESLQLLRRAGDVRRTIVTLSHLAIALSALGERPRADVTFEESVRLAREHGDDWALALALNNLGTTLADRGEDLGRARALAEESLALRRRLGEQRGITVTLLTLAGIALAQNDPAAATPHYEEALRLSREVGLVPLIAGALAGLGLASIQQGHAERAVPLLAEALDLARRLPDQFVLAQCFAGLGAVAGDRGDLARGVRLWGAAERLHEVIGWDPAESKSVGEYLVAAALQELGEPGVEELRAQGRRLSLDEAIAEASSVISAPPH